jgi:hypothetical protein
MCISASNTAKKLSQLVVLATLMLLFCMCRGTKPLTENQYLYDGAEFDFENKKNIPKFNKVESELESVLTPKPNFKLLGMRPLLWLHNQINEPKKDKGFKYWLKYQIGQPPVLYEPEIPERTMPVLSNRLVNVGHFDNEVRYTTDTSGKAMTVIYEIETPEPFTYRQIVYLDNDSLLIDDVIERTTHASLLEEGQNYNLAQLRQERARVYNFLKNNGYFDLDEEDLIYRIDSTLNSRQMDVFFRIKPGVDVEELKPYTINDIYVREGLGVDQQEIDTIKTDRITYITPYDDLRPEIVDRAVGIADDSLYSDQAQRYNDNYLMGLGIFRFSNTTFQRNPNKPYSLDAFVDVARASKKAVSAEVNVVAKTNNFAGPGVRGTYQVRNVFGGSETFSVSLDGRFETQIAGQGRGTNSYEVSSEASLSLPRIIPFYNFIPTERYVPQTRFSLGVGYFKRERLYSFSSVNQAIEYNWRKFNTKFHKLRLIDISITSLLETSDSFQDYLDSLPSLRRSFEEQFIVGTGYTYTVNELAYEKGPPIYWSGSVETAGNLMSLLSRIGRGGPPSDDWPYTLFGQKYSQFARFRSDFRYYLPLGKEAKLATRLLLGTAIPYGNSKSIPYVKQFFVGGPNSLRAFRARSVGPGSYLPRPTQDGGIVLVDQSGDVQVELNTEYRFPIVSVVKGALFVDAGNVWLYNEDEQRGDAEFDWDRFYNEIAVGTGFGLRIDLNIVVVRFDLAFPIREPRFRTDDPADGTEWVWLYPKFKNQILNISIGYPF